MHPAGLLEDHSFRKGISKAILVGLKVALLSGLLLLQSA